MLKRLRLILALPITLGRVVASVIREAWLRWRRHPSPALHGDFGGAIDWFATTEQWRSVVVVA